MAAPAEQDEQLKVKRWRLRELLGLGVSLPDAVAVVDHTDIVHDVRRLIDAGCDPDLAARIAG